MQDLLENGWPPRSTIDLSDIANGWPLRTTPPSTKYTKQQLATLIEAKTALERWTGSRWTAKMLHDASQAAGWPDFETVTAEMVSRMLATHRHAEARKRRKTAT
jgi:hypothetical protein